MRDHTGFEIPEHSAKGGMVRYIQRVAGLSEGAAIAVLRYYEDQRIIRRRRGTYGRDTAYGVDHGAFLDAEVLRRAADLAGTLYAG